MREFFAISILGLNQNEMLLTQLLLSSQGEIPGKNLRILLNINKDQLFEILEKLVQRNIIGYSNNPSNETLTYIRAGEGGYVLNRNYNMWIPEANSIFYKLCKLLDYRCNQQSYQTILNDFSINQNLPINIIKKEVNQITPYELFGLFCLLYKKVLGKEYKPLNNAKDLATLKSIIYEFSYKNIKDKYIKEFIDWVFRVKARSFKSDLIIGWLPLCLKDYLSSMPTEKDVPGFVRDEEGRLRKV